MYSYNKKYKISPKVRELIEKHKGEKISLSHNQVEQILMNAFKGKIEKYNFTDEDKRKINHNICDFSPNDYKKEEINNFVKFLPTLYTDKELVEYIIKITNKCYFPGKVINNLKAYNKQVTYFISLFPKYFNLYKGVIINSDFIGDVKKIFPGVEYDDKTGDILDKDIKDKIDKYVNDLKLKYKDTKISKKDNVFVISSESENDDVINYLSEKKLTIEDIPSFYFKWEN